MDLDRRTFIRRLLAVAAPIMLQQLITNAVNLLDNLMVGQLGSAAIGGVAASNRFFLVGVFAMMGVVATTSIYIAQFYGARQKNHLIESFRFSLIAPLVAVLPFVLGGLLLPLQIIRFFSPDPLVHQAALGYLPIAALALIPQTISFTVQSAMRALGNTRLPLQISILTVLMNGIWNFLLIFGIGPFPALGVTGAALGTLIARLIELPVTLIITKRRDFAFKTRLADLFDIPRHLAFSIFLKSLPLMLNEIGFSGGLAVLFKLYGTRGSDVLSAAAILGTTADLFLVLFSGMAVATTIFVSQALGADNFQAARLYARRLLQMSFSVALVFGAIMVGTSWFLPHLYQVSENVRDIAAMLIRVYGACFAIYAINAQSYFILRSGGNMKITLLMDSGYQWLFSIPLVSAVAYLTDWPILTLYLISQATDLIKNFISLTLVRRGNWVRNLTLQAGVPPQATLGLDDGSDT